MHQDTTEPQDDDEPGGRQIKPANIDPDGQYIVGRGRAPAATRFAVGDGRQRGRRAKGVRNADTEFEQESNRKITVKEGGKERRVTKGHASVIRLFDNANSKGQMAAVIEIDRRRQRLAEKTEANRSRNTASDTELLDNYIRELMGDRSAGLHMLGDPEPDPGAASPSPGADGDTLVQSGDDEEPSHED